MAFVKFRITENANRTVEKRAIAKGVINHHSWGGVRTNKVGILGELIVQQWLQDFGAELHDTHQYDIFLRKLNTKIEVKSKGRNVVPRPDFDASIAAYNTRQQTDYYVCTSMVISGIHTTNTGETFDTFSECYICGVIEPEEFKANSRHYLKQEEPWCQYDCFNLSFNKMMSPAAFLAMLTLKM